MSFRINTPPVVHDTIDGEVVMIHLDTGAYYSMAGAGVDVWKLLAHEQSVPQIVDGLIERYSGSASDIEAAVIELLAKLQAEDLIAGEQLDGTIAGAARPQQNQSQIHKPSFEGFNLQKYTDLNHLLLLDPIHDVDEDGWPNARREAHVPADSADGH